MLDVTGPLVIISFCIWDFEWSCVTESLLHMTQFLDRQSLIVDTSGHEVATPVNAMFWHVASGTAYVDKKSIVFGRWPPSHPLSSESQETKNWTDNISG